MKQASCNMTNTESYIRATVALLIGFFAIQFELWLLLVVSGILFYTAYKKFCIMFSLLGINKKFSVENYFYALLPQYSPYPSCIFDEDGELVYVNNAAKESFETIKSTLDFGISNTKEYILSNRVVDTLFESKGQTYQLHIRGIQEEKILLLYINNITAVLDLEYINSNLEDKVKHALNDNELKNHLLAQQSKFVTTGELIENICHQWKQPLSALAALHMNLQVRHSLKPVSVEEMDAEMKDAARLIKIMSRTVDDFRNFFKSDKVKADFSVASCMNDVMLILGSSLKQEDIQVIDNIDSSIHVRGFKNEFTQVLLNIINNAKDAFIEQQIKGGTITVDSAIEGDKVILRIGDTAGGIPDKYIDKIFHSHFTTKEENGGTGIGLHMSKIIIEQDMNGTIMVENGKEGALFILSFPLV